MKVTCNSSGNQSNSSEAEPTEKLKEPLHRDNKNKCNLETNLLSPHSEIKPVTQLVTMIDESMHICEFCNFKAKSINGLKKHQKGKSCLETQKQLK